MSTIILKRAPRINPAFERVLAPHLHPRYHQTDLILDAQLQSQMALHQGIAENTPMCPWHPTYFYRSVNQSD